MEGNRATPLILRNYGKRPYLFLNPVMEALRGSRMAFELFIAGAGSDRRFEKLLLMAKEKMVPVRQRDKGDISRLCGTEHHQGVALRVEAFSPTRIWRMSWRSGGPLANAGSL